MYRKNNKPKVVKISASEADDCSRISELLPGAMCRYEDSGPITAEDFKAMAYNGWVFLIGDNDGVCGRVQEYLTDCMHYGRSAPEPIDVIRFMKAFGGENHTHKNVVGLRRLPELCSTVACPFNRLHELILVHVAYIVPGMYSGTNHYADNNMSREASLEGVLNLMRDKYGFSGYL